MGRIVDLIEPATGHHRPLLGRSVQVMRIAESDGGSSVEPADLIVVQPDIKGGKVVRQLRFGASTDNWQHALGPDPGHGDLTGLGADLVGYGGDRGYDRVVVG